MTAQWILNDIWNEGYEDGRGGFSPYAPYKGEELNAYMMGWHTGIVRRQRSGGLTIVLKEQAA
jgi:hypothetical protein